MMHCQCKSSIPQLSYEDIRDYELIEVHLEEPDLIFCSCCDGESKEVVKYYKIINAKPEDHIMPYQKYLDCCVNKMGKVVDWQEETYYDKVKRS